MTADEFSLCSTCSWPGPVDFHPGPVRFPLQGLQLQVFRALSPRSFFLLSLVPGGTSSSCCMLPSARQIAGMGCLDVPSRSRGLEIASRPRAGTAMVLTSLVALEPGTIALYCVLSDV